MDPRTVKHALPDLELMIAQVILRLKLRCPAPGSRNAAISVHVDSITEIDLKGIVLTPGEGTSLFGTNRRKGELARVL
jgi:hypothetical protein